MLNDQGPLPLSVAGRVLTFEERFFVVERRNLFCSAAMLLVVIGGCSSGPKLIKANGQLLFNQQPLKVSPQAGISVIFLSLEADQAVRTFPADPLNTEDATFVVPGKNRSGIPIGKYRIVIQQKMEDDLPENVSRMNEMFSRHASAIIREVTNDDPIILDLSKPEG